MGDNEQAITNSHEKADSYWLTPKQTGPNISYSEPVKINSTNIDKLTVSKEINTHGLDEQGNFSPTLADGKTVAPKFEDMTPQKFLDTAGFFEPRTNTGDPKLGEQCIDKSLNVQVVKIKGEAIGYYISKEDSTYGSIGLYVGADALDTSKLKPEEKNSLKKTESPEPPPSTNDPQPTAKPATAFNFCN